FDANDPTLSRTKMIGSARGDFVVGDHASGSIVTGAGNDFITEGQGSGAGTYTAGDGIDAGSGGDVVTGHLGGQIRVGDGDDFVNASDIIRFQASRITSSGAVQLPEIPPEIYADIAPFLRVRAVGDDPGFNPLVGGLDFSYSLDFGDNNVGQPASGGSAKRGVVGSESGAHLGRAAKGGAG